MSQLSKIKRAVKAVLADPQRNGIYRLSRSEFGFTPTLDGRTLHSKELLLAMLAKALTFPDYFDENWDALEECLSDMSWREGHISLLIDHADAIPEALLATLIDVFTSVAQLWTSEQRACCLFLNGLDQPDIPLLA